MDPLNEKANTLSRCGSFYYRTLVDESKSEAEFVSHLTAYNRLNVLGDKITTAIQGGCYYKDYYKVIKFTDKDIDWNGVREALQKRVIGGKGVPYDKLEQISMSEARQAGETAWDLRKEDVPEGLINVVKLRMQVLHIKPVSTPLYLQVYLCPDADTHIHMYTSTNAVALTAGAFVEWSFNELLIGSDLFVDSACLSFQFVTNAEAEWQDEYYVKYSASVGAGTYVPSVQFFRRAESEASIPTFARPAQLTIEDHFLAGDDNLNALAKENTPQAILFPDEEYDVVLPATQELVWDLYIDKDIMVTSICKDDGTMMYANQDFASQFGKITFLVNPIALFPRMQFFAKSYTGRMPNLYNYLVQADGVYGSISYIMRYCRGAQSIRSLYYASAQAAGFAVIEQDCTIVAVSPLLDGKTYITTSGQYDAPYPHTPLKPGDKLKKDEVIGGRQLYYLVGPYDPIPSNITSINLDLALPVPGLSAPNADIQITDNTGEYRPAYVGDASAVQAYWNYIEAQDRPISEPNTISNGIQHFRYTACPNRCVIACINEGQITAQMKLRLLNYLQRELPIGSVLTTANIPVSLRES